MISVKRQRSPESQENENEKPPKKKRVLLSLAKKVEVLDCLAAGASFSTVAQLYNLADSTVRTIKQAEKSIRNSAHYGTEMSNKILFATRPPCIELMETKLNEWYMAMEAKAEYMSNRDICVMAKKIFNDVKPPGDGTSFMASNTWLFNFKKRFSIGKSNMCDNDTETIEKSIGEKFRKTLKRTIEEGGYLPEQVFNIDFDILHWKKLPTDYLESNSQKIPLLFCCNASGDFRSKPLMVYDAKKPDSLSDNNKSLPVFWRSKKRSTITERDVSAWYMDYFIPSVRKYLSSKFLNFKLLIIIERNVKFAALIKNNVENVAIRYLPVGTKHLVQPLSLGIFPAFKRYYLRRMLSHLSQTMFLNPALKLKQCWNVYNIINCVEIIRDAMDEISASDINACWKAIWPEIVHDFSTLPNEDLEIDEILQVVHEISDASCFNVERKDIQLVLGCTGKLKGEQKNEINDKNESTIVSTSSSENSNDCQIVGDSNDFIIQNETEMMSVNFVKGTVMKIASNVISLESINQILESAQNLEHLVSQLDPCASRRSTFSEALKELLKPYEGEAAKFQKQ